MADANIDPDFAENEYDMKLLLHRQSFINGVARIRKKWRIPVDGFPDNKSNNVWRDDIEEDLAIYQNDVRAFIHKLGLSARWYQGISYYIQNNLPGMLRVQSPNPIHFKSNDVTNSHARVESVSIEIDESTTQRELLERFEEAKELLGAEKKKKQPLKNLDRDLDILRMSNKGIKNAEIARRLSDITDSVFNEDDIKTILKRIRLRLK